MNSSIIHDNTSYLFIRSVIHLQSYQSDTKYQMALNIITGRLFHCQVEHHVRDKFATPISYGIDNLKFYDISSTYT